MLRVIVGSTTKVRARLYSEYKHSNPKVCYLGLHLLSCNLELDLSFIFSVRSLITNSCSLSTMKLLENSTARGFYFCSSFLTQWWPIGGIDNQYHLFLINEPNIFEKCNFIDETLRFWSCVNLHNFLHVISSNL